MTKNPAILFVCTGNTCRSAMAEAMWRVMGHSRVGSAGVSAWSGLSAAAHAQEAVLHYGASLKEHRARDLALVDEDYDLVLTMTHSQYQGVLKARPAWSGKTYLLTEFVGESGDVVDPLGQDFAAYQATAKEIHTLLQKLKEVLA